MESRPTGYTGISKTLEAVEEVLSRSRAGSR